MENKIRVLVVDDSAFMRKAITRMIQSDKSFEVMGTASNGQEALERIAVEKPDIVTMDVEMPKMNGLETLKVITANYQIPVIIVCSVSKSGSDLAIRCLESGAIDIVRKPESYVSMNILDISTDLIQKLKTASHIQSKETSVSSLADSTGSFSNSKIYALPTKISDDSLRIVTIGSSTGGPMALHKILSHIPADLPAAIVIVQHMPPGNFIESLANRLDKYSSFRVRMAQDGDVLYSGLALLGPIGNHVTLEKFNGSYRIRLTRSLENTQHCPSIDVLFQSAGEVVGSNNISCVLTGMGSDGTRGLESVHRHGGFVIAESEESCVVYGMPRSAIEAGFVKEILPIKDIPMALRRLVNGT